MEFKRTIIIDQTIEEVWDVLGNQFGEAYKWAGGLYHSSGYGKPTIQAATYNNRTCDTSQGKIKEVIRDFDPQNYRLVYEVIEGFPFFVDRGINHWQLQEQGNKTQVNMHLIIKTKGLMGALMGPMMKMQMNKIVSVVLKDLKHYLETGQPSDSKAKEMAKYAA